MKRIGNDMIFQAEMNGKKQFFNFGNKCYDPLCKDMGVAQEEIFKVFLSSQAFRALRMFIFHAANAGNEIMGLPPVSEQEVTGWFADPGQIHKVMAHAIADITAMADVQKKN